MATAKELRADAVELKISYARFMKKGELERAIMLKQTTTSKSETLSTGAKSEMDSLVAVVAARVATYPSTQRRKPDTNGKPPEPTAEPEPTMEPHRVEVQNQRVEIQPGCPPHQARYCSMQGTVELVQADPKQPANHHIDQLTVLLDNGDRVTMSRQYIRAIETVES